MDYHFHLLLLFVCLWCASGQQSRPRKFIKPSSIRILKSKEKIYYIGTSLKGSFLQAYKLCKVAGMSLVRIQNPQEVEELYQRIKQLADDEHFWTAGTLLIDNSQWIWATTGQTVAYPWPNIDQTSLESRKCLAMQVLVPKGARIRNMDCIEEHSFICERLNDGTSAQEMQIKYLDDYISNMKGYMEKVQTVVDRVPTRRRRQVFGDPLDYRGQYDQSSQDRTLFGGVAEEEYPSTPLYINLSTAQHVGRNLVYIYNYLVKLSTVIRNSPYSTPERDAQIKFALESIQNWLEAIGNILRPNQHVPRPDFDPRNWEGSIGTINKTIQNFAISIRLEFLPDESTGVKPTGYLLEGIAVAGFIGGYPIDGDNVAPGAPASLPFVSIQPSPVVASVPSIPAISGVPGTPSLPGMPSHPGIASLPGMPSLPGISDIPGTASVPGLPSLYGIHGIPGTDSLPGMPSLPGIGGVPGTDSLPGMPSLPGIDGIPGTASLPGLPSLSGVGGVPGTVSLPGMPSLPAIGGVPGTDSLPGMPSLSGVPGIAYLPGMSSVHGIEGFPTDQSAQGGAFPPTQPNDDNFDDFAHDGVTQAYSPKVQPQLLESADGGLINNHEEYNQDFGTPSLSSQDNPDNNNQYFVPLPVQPYNFSMDYLPFNTSKKVLSGFYIISGGVDQSWVEWKYNQKIYMINKFTVTQARASQYCKNRGLALLNMNDHIGDDVIHILISNSGKSGPLDFYWVSGTIPNDQSVKVKRSPIEHEISIIRRPAGNGRCLLVDAIGNLQYAACGQENNFICESPSRSQNLHIKIKISRK